MANLYITEFKNLSVDSKGNIIPIAQVPELRSHTVSFTTAASSDAFKKETKFVRLIADADAYIEFGSAPVAVATSMKLEGNREEYFGVAHTKEMKVSVYDGTS